MMDITYDDLIDILREMYPQQLNHAASEARARAAENRVAELEEAIRGGAGDDVREDAGSTVTPSEAPEQPDD